MLMRIRKSTSFLFICVFICHFWILINGRMIAGRQNILVRNEAIPASQLVSNPNCLMPKDRGNECKLGEENGANGNSTKGKMKWFFDPLSLRCLAFGYEGCGGNANRFDSIMDCHSECLLTGVYGHCVGGEKATAHDANGQDIVCSASNENNNAQCPLGYQCQMMMAHGICCHKKTFETYARNYHPKCANGHQLLRTFDQLNQLSVEVLGQKCEDEFCPQATKCHQQEQFAYCCL